MTENNSYGYGNPEGHGDSEDYSKYILDQNWL
jgi:hypothetical protein